MTEERQTMKNCPACFDAGLMTDDDILWCPKCDYSAACAAQPKRRNQYTRKSRDGECMTGSEVAKRARVRR